MNTYFQLLHLHEVRAVPTKTGYPYYFDAYGHAYIWWKGMLKAVKPTSRKNNQTLKHNKGGGYLYLRNGVNNTGDSKRGRILVHRGVAYAFPEICGTPDLFRNQVDHINGDRFDNRASNLRWVSQSENIRSAIAKRKAQQLAN